MDSETANSGTKKSTKLSGNKRQKFVELAQKRTINAIKAIRVIAKLSNRSAYDYTEADIKKIASALQKEIEALKARMTSKESRETIEFEL